MAYTAPTAELGTEEYTRQLNANAPSLGLTPINTQTLSSSTSPLVLSTPEPTISPTPAMVASAQAGVDADKEAQKFAQEQMKGVNQIQQQKKGVLDYLGLRNSQAEGLYADAQRAEETNVAPAQKELADIRSREADVVVQYRAEQDAIKGRGDITKEAQAGLQMNADDKYGRVLADLAIRKSAAIANVADLRTAIDRKLQFQLAPIEREQKFFKDFLENNFDELTKNEKDRINLQISERDKRKKEITDNERIAQSAYETAAKSGIKIPDVVVQEITQNPGQAYQILAANGIGLQSEKERMETQKLRAEIDALGGVKIQRVDAAGNPLPPSPQEQALQVILGSGKFTKDQKATITNSIRNGEDPFVVIKNQAKALMTGTNQTKVESYETAYQAMQDLKGALDAYYAAGGSTSYLRGNYEKVINKLGEVNDPRLVELATQIQTQLQVYRNAVSGTAYSVQEGTDIASIFPGINKSQGLNEAILKGRESAFNSAIDGAYRGVLGSAYDQIKQPETPKETPPTTTPAYNGLFEGKDYRTQYGY